MARVDDLDNKPQIKPAAPRKAKRQDAEQRASTKARTKRPAARTRAIKTVTVDVAGVTYIGWYWIENSRMFVTYHEQPKSEGFPCACCTSDGTAPSVRP